jgi:heme-degrading monooxygenase HmoA
VRFESHEALRAWHDHPEHVAAQQLGRERSSAAQASRKQSPSRSSRGISAEPRRSAST